MNFSTSRLFRKIIVSVLLIALTASLSGCAKSEQSADTSSNTSSAASSSASAPSSDETLSAAASTSSGGNSQTSLSGTASDTSKASAVTPSKVASSPSKASAATSSQSTAPTLSGSVGYSINNVKSLTNFTYTTEVYKNGKTTTPFQVFRTPTRIKVAWLFENENEIIGTVQYSDSNDKQFDGKYYKQIRFHGPSRRGADTGYKGKNLVSAWHLWEKHDVTSLLNGTGVTKLGNATVAGLPVTVYSVSSGGKTHKIYYNTQYKVWLKYEILKGSAVEESYTAKGFKVGGVTADQATWPTKLTGNEAAPGYALLDMTGMGMIKESDVLNDLEQLAY